MADKQAEDLLERMRTLRLKYQARHPVGILS